MRMFKLIAKIIGTLLCAIVLAVVAAAAGYRIHGQHAAAEILRIQAPNGIVDRPLCSGIGFRVVWIRKPQHRIAAANSNAEFVGPRPQDVAVAHWQSMAPAADQARPD